MAPTASHRGRHSAALSTGGNIAIHNMATSLRRGPKKKKSCYCVIPTTIANSIPIPPFQRLQGARTRQGQQTCIYPGLPVLEHQPTQMAAVITSGLLSVAFCVCRGRRRRGEKKGMSSVDDQRTRRRKLDPEMGNGNSIGRTAG